jgi:hypothetical protein
VLYFFKNLINHKSYKAETLAAFFDTKARKSKGTKVFYKNKEVNKWKEFPTLNP